MIMAFIVEDGTVVAEANSYASVEFADALLASLGKTSWTSAILAKKQECLVSATAYMDTIFAERYKGSVIDRLQALEWPRKNIPNIPITEMPILLKKACALYAYRALTAVLLPDPTTDANGFLTTVKRQKLGPLEREFQRPYSGTGSTAMVIRPYPEADLLVARLLVPRMGGVLR
jgi:hypothetical protein